MSYRPATSTAGIAGIKRQTALTLSPLSVDADEGATVTFTGRLTDSPFGNPIPGKSMSFFLGGVNTGVGAVTDANGDYGLSYAFATYGTYSYDVRYLGT